MKIATLVFNPIQENTYIVWDETKECVIIDAGNNGPREDIVIKNFIAEHGLTPKMAINTHGHFDHTLGVEYLKQEYGIPFAHPGPYARPGGPLRAPNQKPLPGRHPLP